MRPTAGQQHRANIASRNYRMNNNDCWGNPKSMFVARHPDILTEEIRKLESANRRLLDALHKIDANAAESVEWIRRTARQAITDATFKPQ